MSKSSFGMQTIFILYEIMKKMPTATYRIYLTALCLRKKVRVVLKNHQVARLHKICIIKHFHCYKPLEITKELFLIIRCGLCWIKMKRFQKNRQQHNEFEFVTRKLHIQHHVSCCSDQKRLLYKGSRISRFSGFQQGYEIKHPMTILYTFWSNVLIRTYLNLFIYCGQLSPLKTKVSVANICCFHSTI